MPSLSEWLGKWIHCRTKQQVRESTSKSDVHLTWKMSGNERRAPGLTFGHASTVEPHNKTENRPQESEPFSTRSSALTPEECWRRNNRSRWNRHAVVLSPSNAADAAICPLHEGEANHSKRCIFVSNVSMTYHGFSESNTSDWFPYVWAFPQDRWRLRRLHILAYATQLSCNFQHSHSTFCHHSF